MTMIGSARSDERGKIIGGKAGDQTSREVSTQSYYVHSKGWVLLRAKENEIGNGIASAMIDACANENIGYDQGQRDSIVSLFKKTKKLSEIDKACECDCSKLIQLCVWEATGKDPGNFTTASAVSVLSKTGYFEPAVDVTKDTVLYTGDILCTKTKGHIVAVTKGKARSSKKEKYVTTANLNVRSGAGIDKDRLGTLKKGTTCTVLSKGHEVNGVEWFKVESSALTGFVSSKYLSKK